MVFKQGGAARGYMNWFELNINDNDSAQVIQEKIAELLTQLADVEQKLRQARDKERFAVLKEAEEVGRMDVFG
jgi:predicted ATP-binding protein involved in virulence